MLLALERTNRYSVIFTGKNMPHARLAHETFARCLRPSFLKLFFSLYPTFDLWPPLPFVGDSRAGLERSRSEMAGAQQQRLLILHLLAHLPRMEQPGVALVHLGVKARPADVVAGSDRLSVLVVGAKLLPVVLEHFPSESLVAGVVGVPAAHETPRAART